MLIGADERVHDGIVKFELILPGSKLGKTSSLILKKSLSAKLRNNVWTLMKPIWDVSRSLFLLPKCTDHGELADRPRTIPKMEYIRI